MVGVEVGVGVLVGVDVAVLVGVGVGVNCVPYVTTSWGAFVTGWREVMEREVELGWIGRRKILRLYVGRNT
jgi:hypothetical protein